MNYEQRYNEALERARKEYKTHESFNGFRVMLLHIFPELKESEDERISEEIITYLSTVEDKELIPYESWLAWLKKQGEQKPIERKDFISIPFGAFDSELVNETITIPDGCVATIEGNKIHIKKEGKTALEAIKEEKVDNANKVEPKFKVGDWVVRKDGGVFFTDIKFAQITEIDGEKHWFDTGLICLKAEDMRLWTLEDAKDGDILYSKKHNLLWRYKNTKECYYCINLNYNNNNISIGNEIVIPNDVRPASKELRDWQFDKMLQHAFSKINGKKELEKQGEHNPTDNDDKIEPKFHEDDWIVVSGEAILICDIHNNLYDVIFADGEHRLYDTNILDKESHLWTIEDAKDGDVLISWTNKPFIYNGFYNETYVGAYCGLNTFNRIIIADKQDHLHNNWTINKDVKPASKEQRDFLFQKIEDKGYEWDDEKKLLKN